MLTILRHLLVVVAFSAISLAEGARPTECEMWREASTSTMEQEFLNVTCASNKLCTGFHCSGLFLFQNHVYGGSEPFGFAVEFIPCSYPLVLRILINATDLRFMKMVGVHGRNEDAILLMVAGASGFDEPFGRLNLAWNAVLKPVKYFVNLQVNFTRIFMSGEFLPIPIVPLRNFPIPNCQYEPKDEGARADLPLEKSCVGVGCAENPQKEEPMKSLDSDFIIKTCIGVGVFLVALCVLLGVVFVRRHRSSNRVQKLKVEEYDSSSEEEVSLSSSQSSVDDRKDLLRV